MDASEAILGKYVHDFSKVARSRAEIVKDDIIHALLDGQPVDDKVKELRSHLERIESYSQFPKINVITQDMPDGVLLMAFGSGGTFSRLMTDGTVEHGVVSFQKGTAQGGIGCSTPTSS